jgi:chemotaxis response regulator CheB
MSMIVSVLSNQALLMQGIISRLQSSAPALDIQIVETSQPEVVEKWIALQPDVVILESKELSDPSIFPLNRLFTCLPHLVVMEVNLETSDIQIIRSDQYTASGVADLLNILQSASGNHPGVFSSI